VRPRTMLYAGVLALVSGLMLWHITHRHTVELDVIRDRNPDFVTLADGAVRNGYTIKLMNMASQPRAFAIGLDGISAREVKIIGEDGRKIMVPADKVRTLRVLVTVARKDLSPGSAPVHFAVTEEAYGEQRRVGAVFVSGENP